MSVWEREKWKEAERQSVSSMMAWGYRWYGNCFCERSLEEFWQQKELLLCTHGEGPAIGNKICLQPCNKHLFQVMNLKLWFKGFSPELIMGKKALGSVWFYLFIFCFYSQWNFSKLSAKKLNQTCLKVSFPPVWTQSNSPKFVCLYGICEQDSPKNHNPPQHSLTFVKFIH